MKGRNTGLSNEEIEKIRYLGESGKISITNIAKSVGLSKTTVKKYLRSLCIPFPGHGLRGPEHVDEKHWRCKNCNEIRDVDDFLWLDVIKKDQRQTHCKHCVYAQTDKRLGKIESFLKNKVSSLRFTANKDGIPFNLSWPYLSKLLTQQNQRCFYTDVELVWGRGSGQTDSRFRATVDKIEPKVGYVIGNVVWCSRRSNIIKSDMTLDEMQEWMPDWWQRLQNFMK